MGKVEYYTIKPNLKQIYGKKVFKDTEFKEKTEDGRVHQTFKDLTLTTKIKSKVENAGFTIKEDTTLTIKVPEGTILVWDEGEGFIIPQCQMCTLEELEEEIFDMKEIYNPKNKEDVNDDTKGNEGESI